MKPTVWSEGRLITFDEAGVDQAGWPVGTGIFETIKTVDGSAWHLSRHMRRALTSAKRNDIPFPSEELIRNAVAATITANPFPIGRLRLLFASDGQFLVTHQEYFEASDHAKLIIFPDRFESSKIVEKRFPYDRNLALLDSARSQGFDDGILLNERDLVAESSIANLVFEIDGQWVTPPLVDGVLPGVIRALAIEKLGIQVRSIGREELNRVDAGLLPSSLKIAQPISQIAGRTLPNFQGSEQMRSRIAATAIATSVG